MSEASSLRDSAPAASDFSITTHSKSFALASRLLDTRTRDHTAIVYEWCRRADDAVDCCEPSERGAAVDRLLAEVDDIYRVPARITSRVFELSSSREAAARETPPPVAHDAVLSRFTDVVLARRIPRTYPAELVAGMAMDAADARYDTLADLRVYCYRVAGTVGLMMAHVFGVSDDAALTSAAHLGMAMQLTNICRDVMEDWQRGRLYIPAELVGDLSTRLGEPFPGDAIAPMARAVRTLLGEADRYYASGDRGIAALPWRAALAASSARRVYAAIGDRIARTGYDVTAGRAIVPRSHKLALVARAACRLAVTAPARWFGRRRPHVPSLHVELGDVALG